jgi:exopolyphosphatase/guanosine-5'-triphosphate,3'-diphosphate pyrophosphatase
MGIRAGVIDVGSNSIKLLVAERDSEGRVVEVASNTLETRISMGIGSGRPYLHPEGIEQGLAAIAELSAQAGRSGSDQVTVVATSAVRDATNGPEFVFELKRTTGLKLRILSGDEEASLIGRGLTTDPALLILRNFHAYDLGGGSLECLSFANRKVRHSASLPLGCVRLTEMFVADPSAPLGSDAEKEIGRHVKEALLTSGVPLPVPSGFGVVGTGGTLTTVRAMVGANRGMPVKETNPVIGVTLLHEILGRISALDLEARKKVPGLPPARADVFPAALVTLLALAELGAIQSFHHSLHNLRWGVAAELLG